MIFDTHAHYDDESFDADRDALLLSLPEKGVGGVINVGAALQGARDSVALSEKFPFVYAAAGIHPDEGQDMNEAAMEEIRELSGHEKTVMIGEIGLDYHGFDRWPDKTPKETQKYWFRRQLELAMELGLPVCIHSRNAAEDTLEFMTRAHREGLIGGIIHCFSYSREIAEKYLGMGFYLGIGGSLTYPGQKKLTKVLEAAPLTQIVLETDSPYLAPVPHKGERNDSSYLAFVRDLIAQIKGVTPEEVERATFENAQALLRMKPCGH